MENPDRNLLTRKSKSWVQLDMNPAKTPKSESDQIQPRTHFEIHDSDLDEEFLENQTSRLISVHRSTARQHSELELLLRSHNQQKKLPASPLPSPPLLDPEHSVKDEEIHPLLLKYPFDNPHSPNTPPESKPAEQQNCGPLLDFPSWDFRELTVPELSLPEQDDNRQTAINENRPAASLCSKNEPAGPSIKRKPGRRRITYRSPHSIHGIRDLFTYYGVWLTFLTAGHLMAAREVARVISQATQNQGSTASNGVIVFSIFTAFSLLCLRLYRGQDYRQFLTPFLILSLTSALIWFLAKILWLANSA